MGIHTFAIYPKIEWNVDLTHSWQDVFYPSTVKRILKHDSFFKINLSVSVDRLTFDFFEKTYFPLYEQYIVERPDYHLDAELQKQKIIDRINSNLPTYIIGVIEKKSQSFCGGILFTVWPDRVTTLLRVYDKNLIDRYKQEVTVDYWLESKFHDHLQKYQKQILRHGTDTHPYVDKIGLALFKLKIGARPYIAKNYQAPVRSTHEDLKDKKDVVLLFTHPDSQKKFSNALLLRNNTLSLALQNEFEKVLDWTEITLTIEGN